jgi:hypothetical protein
MPDHIQILFDRAAQLPLMDAAFLLWTQRHNINWAEAPPNPRPHPSANLSDPAIFKQVVRSAIAAVEFERDNAQYGVTFQRLRKIHPDANDADLQSAIRAAVKLDQDCFKHFAYSAAGLGEDAERAVDLARRANPGFQDSTYTAAAHLLMQQMR